jgi:hypothetical protein
MSEETDIHQEVTINQLGTRVNRLDGEVESMRGELNEVKTTVASSAAITEGLRGDMTVLFGKMDRLSENTGSAAATRGMIPVGYVTWGAGLMVSLTSIGLTVLGLGAAVVIWAQSSGDKQVSKDVATNTAEIQENEDVLGYLSRWRDEWLIEWGVIQTEIKALKESYSADIGGHDDTVRKIARLEENLKWACKEIADHKDEQNHPLLQTEAIKGLRSDINRMFDEISTIKLDVQRIDFEGSRVSNRNQESP